jgi:NAD(P)-dependent dehydrogenase (short-subunit alcohol dehydrogenase family)
VVETRDQEGTVFDLSGRTALVTGAGQNVGAGIARSLAAQGATVVVNDLVAERAEATASTIREAGGSAATAVFDVTDLAAVESAVAAIDAVDILVSNAGNAGAEQMGVAPFVEMEPNQWEGPIRVNLYGVLHCCRATVPRMMDRGWGRVITISSGAGTGGVNIGVSPYSAGKGGGIAFTRTLALEVAGSGVTANSLALGLMGMPDPTVTEHLARRIPVGRTGTPEDIGAACVWLASDEAAWVTAQTIQINGGSITT